MKNYRQNQLPKLLTEFGQYRYFVSDIKMLINMNLYNIYSIMQIYGMI